MTTADHNHYFIELSEPAGDLLSSGTAASLRAERARAFIANLQQWLADEGLSDQLSALRITALGQIMLTCTPNLIAQAQAAAWPDVSTITAPTHGPLPELGERRTA